MKFKISQNSSHQHFNYFVSYFILKYAKSSLK